MKNEMTYAAKKRAAQLGREVFEHVLRVETLDPAKFQRELLLRLLDDNKDTEYGRRYGFSEIHSIEEYRRNVPVITYEDIADEIERMKRGEKNVLTAYAFDHMNTTAGTVGKQKTIPMTAEQQKVFEKYNYHYLNGLYDSYCDPGYLSGRTFTPIGGKYVRNESGITLGCASTKAAEYIGGMEKLDAQMSLLYTSPSEVMFAKDDTDMKYIHMRFAMADRDMTGIVIGFFSYLVQLFHYIETNYEVLIDDIEKGCISDSVRIDDATRQKLMKKIIPMPERAAELREIFKNGPGLRFVPLIWPELRYISGVGGDGFAIYDRVIRDKYVGSDIHYFYMGVTASEGLWSVPRGKESTDGILAAGSAFMEFLPEEANGDLSQIKSIDELEEGKVYELIITDLCGLYRYRVFDCVKVTGFVNKTPCVDYMYRANRTINIAGEKLTEAAVRAAVEALAEEYGLPLADYNVYADKEQMPGQHQFLFEFDASAGEIDTEALREPLYRQLCIANEKMKFHYEMGNIALPAICRLQPETNILYRDLMVYRGTSAAQLKPVRIIVNDKQKDFFFGMREK